LKPEFGSRSLSVACRTLRGVKKVVEVEQKPRNWCENFSVTFPWLGKVLIGGSQLATRERRDRRRVATPLACRNAQLRLRDWDCCVCQL
jgi:hypothetical protein